jgi:hypothetical protein
MPRLDFAVLADGLLVDVLIGLDGDPIAAQLAAGQPVAPPVLTRGEVDTGSNMTAVSTAILRRLGVPVQYQATTLTAAGPRAVDIFEISVGLRNLADPTGDTLVEPKLAVMEVTTALPGVEVLVGLDFLLACRFLLDGPARRFSLES